MLLISKAYAGVLSLNQPMHCQYFLEVSRWFLFLFLPSSDKLSTSFVKYLQHYSTLNLCMAPEFCSHLAMLCLSLSFSLVLWADTLNISKIHHIDPEFLNCLSFLRGTSEFSCQLTTTKPGKNTFTMFTVPVPEKV